MGRRTAPEGDDGTRFFRFADVVVDVLAHTLERGGVVQPVEPKAFAVLLVLLRRPHELVPRDDLIDLVWGHQHVTPGVLTRVIAQLRHALGDDPHQPRFIRTRHALGYCFIGDLLPVDDGGDAREATRSASEGPGQPTPTAGHATAPGPRGEANPDGASDFADAGGRAEPATTLAGATPLLADHAGQALPPAGQTGRAHPPAAETGAAGLARAGDGQGAGEAELGFGKSAAETRAIMAHRVPPTASASVRPTRARRGLMTATAIVAVALAALLAWRMREPAPAGPAVSEASIAVLPFSSLSSDRRDAYFAEGLAVEMHDALAGVPGLKVAARGTMPSQDDDVRTLGRRLGVATVLDASIRREGRRVRVNARLSDTATGFTLWSDTYDREVSDVFAVQTQVANEVVRALLGVLPRNGALRARLAPTRSVAAFEAYLKGLRELQSAATAGGADRSIGFFQQALAADAGFARAQAGICRAQIRRLEEVRDGPAFERARQACDRAGAMDPTLREVSLAFGEIERVQGHHEAAIAQYTRALADPALRPDAYAGLARVESARGRHVLARQYYARALALRPGDAALYRGLGYQHYLEGDLAAAVDAYRTATTLQPDDADLWASLGGVQLANGDRVQAAEAFERSLALSPNYAALSNLGTLRFETGAYAAAAALFRRATQAMPEDYRPWGNLGDTLLADPATAAQAPAAFARAATLARRYVEVERTDAEARAQLAWFSASLGDPVAARRWAAEAEAMGASQGEVAFWTAQAMARLGDRDAATLRLQRARAGGIPAQRIAAVPGLRGLSGSGVASTQGTTNAGRKPRTDTAPDGATAGRSK